MSSHVAPTVQCIRIRSDRSHLTAGQRHRGHRASHSTHLHRDQRGLRLYTEANIRRFNIVRSLCTIPDRVGLSTITIATRTIRRDTPVHLRLPRLQRSANVNIVPRLRNDNNRCLHIQSGRLIHNAYSEEMRPDNHHLTNNTLRTVIPVVTLVQLHNNLIANQTVQPSHNLPKFLYLKLRLKNVDSTLTRQRFHSLSERIV